jgi:hypothetical protein
VDFNGRLGNDAEMSPFTRVEVGLIRREGITKAAVDKIPISSTAYGLFAHETAKESPASETGQVEEVERPKLELTPVQAVPHHRFVRRRQGGSGSVGNRPSDNFGR